MSRPEQRPHGVVAKTLLISAGGTGGHITPGISIAEAWLAEGGKVVIATLIKNIEYPDIQRLARDKDVCIVAYDAPRLTKNPLHFIGFFRRFWSAYKLVRQAARAEGVAAVLGMGGYSSFPSVVYAVLARKPLYLCEQNARWGIVTRLFRFFSKRVFLSFEAKGVSAQKYPVTGNPLRAMFTQSRAVKRQAKSSFKHILFLGGSQGANDINALYSAFIASPQAKKYHCLVAAGPQGALELKTRGRKSDEILPFITDMPAAYAAADFIVARCGSGTLFEILWSGKPAFLIPFPFAAADHQRANADAIQSQIACYILDERPFSATAALAAFQDFLARPAPVGVPAKAGHESRAEEQIIRYLKEEI
jgi:UDP-N-acetylglucosamine--N-acetylmuramyl-(pentapeptide) pyrophosphoryl-undecaprenol N-acetylglucosamine transferase